MGVQGPLAALALGRSPYDEVFDGQGEPDHREPPQQFDQRGRPINPETKRLNRDLIRAHNEVMLVIGVAEPENPNAGPEAERAIRHYVYEDAVGARLGNVAQQCVQAVGVFGIAGARQRILVYREYSQIPFWDMYERARRNFSFPSMVFAGAPASLLSNYLEAKVARLWFAEANRTAARKLVHQAWSYIKAHLELFAAMQHLGILPYRQILPYPSFFMPFSDTSPIPAPPPLYDFTGPAALAWAGQAIANAIPFIIWIFARRLYRDWRPRVWTYILRSLPSTMFSAKVLPMPPPPPLPIPETPVVIPAEGPVSEDSQVEVLDQNSHTNGPSDDIFESLTPPLSNDGQHATPPEALAAASGVLAARADDLPSDEEDNEGLSATLISFDVEATDSAEAPAGLWSAELRPSAGPETKSLTPVHLDTGLTQLPVGLACDILTDSFVKLVVAPYEAVALRNMATIFLLRQGFSVASISRVRPFEGLTLTALVNFLSIELLSLSLSGEVWAIFTRLAQFFHRTEEEWKRDEDVIASSWWHNYL